MRAVITAVGKNRPGIMSFVSSECAKRDANIMDVTQTVLQELFTMIMIVEYNDDRTSFMAFVNELEEAGAKEGLKIHVMHEDLFTAMHKL